MTLSAPMELKARYKNEISPKASVKVQELEGYEGKSGGHDVPPGPVRGSREEGSWEVEAQLAPAGGGASGPGGLSVGTNP